MKAILHTATAIALSLSATSCTIQGTQRFTPTGIRVGQEVGLGSGALEMEKERNFARQQALEDAQINQDRFNSNSGVTINNYGNYNVYSGVPSEEYSYDRPTEIAVYNRHDYVPNEIIVTPVW